MSRCGSRRTFVRILTDSWIEIRAGPCCLRQACDAEALLFAIVSRGSFLAPGTIRGAPMRKQTAPPDPASRRVGEQIQRRRRAFGIIDKFLSEALEMTFFEYQGCETGERRTGAAGLLELAELLEASPSFSSRKISRIF
jgi:hypothetical protein